MILAAPPGERLFEPPPAILAAKGRFTVVLLICFLLHAIPISLFAYLDGSDDPAPAAQEIPVEMIVEPPTQKEPPPEPKSEPKVQATLDEKVATDAPRAPNDEKVMKDAQDEATQSPKAAPGAEAANTKPADASENSTNSKPTEASAPLPMDHGDPVATADLQRPDASAQVKAALQPRAQQNAAPNPLTAFAAMPDYSFAPASRHATNVAGKAASTYLSILYGMVMSHIRPPEGAAGHARTMGEVIFRVDLAGRFLGERVVQSSGSPELDSAAMAAIRAAAPFPPPPTGTGLSLTFRYGK